MSRSAHRTGHLIALDTIAAPPPDCALGCTSGGRHLPDCEDTDVCAGCTPRPATDGLLCWTCYRRLQLMLTQAPAAETWVHGNLARTTASALREDHDRRRGGDDDGAPEPIRLEVLDQIDTLSDALRGWLIDYAHAHHLPGDLDDYTIATTSRYLLVHLDHLAPWWPIDQLLKDVAQIMSALHALAPWRPTAQRIPGVPCPHCRRVALTLFGGEEDVTCTRCKTMIPPGRYGMWVRMLEAEHQAKLDAAAQREPVAA